MRSWQNRLLAALLAVAGGAGCLQGEAGPGESPDAFSSPTLWLMNLIFPSNPFTVTSIPADGASGIATNAALILDFTAQADAATISQNAALGPCNGSVQLSFDDFANCAGLNANLGANPRIIFTPTLSLASGANYKVRVSTAVRSVTGFSLGSQYESAFSTGGAADITPPGDVTFLAATPQADRSIQLVWTNPGDADLVGVKILRMNGATCTTNPNDAGASVVYNGIGVLYIDTATVHAQQYCYTIFAYDNSLNFAAGGAGAQLSATANDGTAPTVGVLSPASGASSVALNQTLSIPFSEAMNPATITTAAADGACSGNIEVRVGPAFTACKGFTVSTGDNTTFTLTPAGNMLEGREYRINVLTGVQDAAGNALASSVNVNPGFVTSDLTAPSITNVTSTTADGLYGIGAVINIQVQFDEPIVVAGGTPTFTLETGGTDAVASFTGVTGGDTVNFEFTVANPHVAADLDYIPAPFNLAGATIQDAAGNNAVLGSIPAPNSTGSLRANKALVIDGAPPVVFGLNSTATDGLYGLPELGQVLPIQVVFTSVVNVDTGGGTPTLTLETGTSDAVLDYTNGSGTTTLVFNYTVDLSHVTSDLNAASISALALNGGTIRDAAGNDAVVTLAAPGSPGSLGANKAIQINTAVTSQLPDTGQTICYYDNAGTWTQDPTCAQTYTVGSATHPFGQDANYANTPAAFSLSATDGNTTVLESTTGLYFENNAGQAGPFANTGAAANACTVQTTAGRTWRLPTVREMLMHYNFNLANPAVDTGANLFTGTGAAGFYWTANQANFSAGNAFNVAYNFVRLEITANTTTRAVRCVAGPAYPASNLVARTAGAAYTVFDITSNLSWTKCSMGGGGTQLDAGAGACTLPTNGVDNMAWVNAIAACENLTYAGKSDWRLPNIRELTSLVLYDAASTPLISTTFFPNTANIVYWSSTNSAAAANFDRAQTVNFSNGQTNALVSGLKTTLHYVRCVRTGH